MNASWAKSSFSFSNGNCVEVAELPGHSVAVRDSQDPAGPVLRFTRGGWNTFLGGARRGKFDGLASMLPAAPAATRIPGPARAEAVASATGRSRRIPRS